ncbi:DUF2808 domain-containing protein [Leptolyngbya sp. NIES-2104]|uniref:DUF2808 domain-containing protein n=1 Tax=Leptolyngbya sp. NIES-2104 TaxID=1552121 RepID=UPI0006ECA7ED|nr:DUF2808 domain-containing protein [Leptolyngbya sp. NIES-2104]GAP96862.1 hypothetical protein NIES2104_34090 [Leptolyngbya sp. NIES-2104]
MQFHTFTIPATLAVTTVLSMQLLSVATTKSDLINQLDSQPDLLQVVVPRPDLPRPDASQVVAPQAVQPKANTESTEAGQTSFSRPPTLIQVVPSRPETDTPSTYEFTLTVPQDAQRPLKAVTIVQDENAETIEFDVSSSKAYTGTQLTANSEIRLASVGGQPANPGEATIVFDQPVLPGNTVTIALSAQKNPSGSGVYLFGVTAYPDGENGLGQFLGYGRINFYGNINQ